MAELQKSRLIVLSENPVKLRAECKCGGYYHIISADDQGQPVMDSFVVGETKPDDKAKPRGKGVMAGFFNQLVPDPPTDPEPKGGA